MKFYKIWGQNGCIKGFACENCVDSQSKVGTVTMKKETDENVQCLNCGRCKSFM
ncbi:MAG: hypothetical protein ACXABU_17115 [Candidatus Hodarchaeales archaeon]|jgi:hypothetical protein